MKKKLPKEIFYAVADATNGYKFSVGALKVWGMHDGGYIVAFQFHCAPANQLTPETLGYAMQTVNGSPAGYALTKHEAIQACLYGVGKKLAEAQEAVKNLKKADKEIAAVYDKVISASMEAATIKTVKARVKKAANPKGKKSS